ncbi:TPA: helix-turn-helix domain-containing protein [Vibrio parahaemolyticus]|uniref:helix-turn-helix domain-containing protein n=1 Tax=Vibrio harveyi group TaxID=717610 RepID=UPI00084B345C|nr:helix-turn-helix domain-containing protein [Vibrio parahaemolyticus]MBE4266512.1 chromosome partitioning protein ParA [Vibrio parahaemolyticus]MBE4415855.1 chromosome partitioning protein ParA [Vibrio parahaemolyticus]ODY11635.1 chromosome partitioning protein ParA [Vibrio parahaemolyticus]HCE3660180.1 helix-turn-helix domain-containing protein [Vibrio parahaemolyticus]HCG5577121.1 helix-turn-helix domain-containing protein [Vibrio parahaemolyticus]
MKMEKIPPFDYLKGEAFTDTLKEVTGCKTLLEMSELFDVPKATFSAWNTHNRTSHELMVRLHLAKGIPIERMALSGNELNKIVRDKSSANNPLLATSSQLFQETSHNNPQHEVVILKSLCLTNGQLIETGEIPYPARRINSYGLDKASLIEVETNEAIYLLDKSTKDAVAGKYLIDVDGRLSLNHIQRLPGKKLAVVFGDSTIEVSEEDIKVIGRVAVTLRKE